MERIAKTSEPIINRVWMLGPAALVIESKTKNERPSFALPENKYARETEIPKVKEDTNILPRPKSLTA